MENRTRINRFLTLREEIAKDFMVAMLTNPALLEVVTDGEIQNYSAAHKVSQVSLKWADIFLNESEQ